MCDQVYIGKKGLGYKLCESCDQFMVSNQIKACQNSVGSVQRFQAAVYKVL